MKRVFISFKIEDRPQVSALRMMAANERFDLEFYDESVRTPYNSSNATYIRSRIKEKIARTSVTLCLLNSNTHTSEWVRWELEESLNKGNAIIGMGVKGVANALTLPEPMRRLKLPWNIWDVDLLTRQLKAA